MKTTIHKKDRHEEIMAYLISAPFLLIFFTFTVLPVVISIVLSFTNFNMLQAPTFIGAENYSRLFLHDSIFKKAVGNTLILAVVTGPLSYLLSLFVAWFINELSPKMRALVTLIFYAPSISGNVYLVWQMLFSNDSYGYVNATLYNLGIITQPIMWLKDTRYLLTIICVVALWTSLGTSFLTFISGFQGVDRGYYEAAAMDGVKNRWQELWFITLPLIKPQMMFGAVMNITASFGIGAIVTNLAGFPTTDYAAHTILNHLEDYGTTRYELGYASAIATVLFLMMVGCNILIQRILSKVGK